MDKLMTPECKLIIDTLYRNGETAYIVGGAVRDFIMNRQIHDYDIATSATCEKIKSLFSHTADTGIKFGTVTVIHNNEKIEVTTYRCEGRYKNNRKPSQVFYTKTINEDLSRRDFTINALAYNHIDGLIDLFDGQNDIKNKIIRAINNPDERFYEDALRMLRAFRFSARLGFDIEPVTRTAIFNCSHLIKNLSAERINSELCGILMCDNLSVLKAMQECSALDSYIICDKIEDSSIKNIESAPKLIDARLAVFIYELGIDEKSFMQKLKFSNKAKKSVSNILELMKNEFPQTKPQIKRAMGKYGPESVCLAAQIASEIYKKENITKIIQEVLKSGQVYTANQLDLSGYQLVELGIEKEKIKEVINQIYELVVDEKLENKNKQIVNYIKRNIIVL